MKGTSLDHGPIRARSGGVRPLRCFATVLGILMTSACQEPTEIGLAFVVRFGAVRLLGKGGKRPRKGERQR